jgi:hypothetical protein
VFGEGGEDGILPARLVNTRIRPGAGVSKGPGAVTFTPPKVEVMQRANEIPAGRATRILNSGVHAVTPGAAVNGAPAPTTLAVGLPGQVRGPVTLVFAAQGAHSITVPGGTINGTETPYDCTKLASVTLHPGAGSNWIAEPNAAGA